MNKFPAVLSLLSLSFVTLALPGNASAQDEIKQAILKLFPQADQDKDGAISDAEEAAARQQVVKRFPRADRDGDGVLSDTETKAVLRRAANRTRMHNSNRDNTQTAGTKKT